MKKMINIYCLGKYGFKSFEETCDYLYSGATEYEKEIYSKRLKEDIINELEANGLL